MKIREAAVLALFLILFSVGIAEADENDSRPRADKAIAKVIEDRTTKVLSYLTGESEALPEKLLATAGDIPEIEYREVIIQNLRDEVTRLRAFFTSSSSSFEKIEVFEPHTSRKMTIASVTIWGRESEDGELESRDIAWVKTSTGEWKLIEL